MKKEFIKKVFLRSFLALFVLLFLLCITSFITNKIKVPQNDREWARDQAVLPEITFNDHLVTIRNIRNFSYTSTSTYTPSYYDKTFDLEKIQTVDYIVEPFSGFGMAHTFLSFGFEDGTYVAISVEIRKELGEQFSPLQGLFAMYEIMYVIADERDVLPLRAIHRKDPVYLYPVQADKDAVRALFVSMLTRAETLRTNPEFYNTLTNTCTTNIIGHVNELVPGRTPWDIRILFPNYSDQYAYELGLIDTTVSVDALRTTYDVSAAIARYADDPLFSEKIRN